MVFYIIICAFEKKSETKGNFKLKIHTLSSQEGQKFHLDFSKIKSTIRCNAFLGKSFGFC